jgi:threonine/homoserine/homoserine lactone efflux protein
VDPLFLAYLSLTAALVVTPGATTAVVVRNTLSSGWRGGLAAAVGAAAGNAAHAAAAGLGLAVIIARIPALLLAIQVAGALYLAWLGFGSAKRLISGEAVPISSAILEAHATIEPHHAVREGVTVNLLNPAIATFYLAVVPSFLPAGAPRGYFVQLAAVHVGMAFVCHSLWALGMDRLRHLLARPAARLALEALTAAALFLLAVRVLASASW